MKISRRTFLKTTAATAGSLAAFPLDMATQSPASAEDAVQKLPGDAEARQLYLEKFALMRSALNPNGVLIVADSARTNFWNTLGLPSPLARTIEWNKHQDPKVWTELAQQSGFTLKDLRWSYLHPFPRLTANFMAQYVTASHFILRFMAAP